MAALRAIFVLFLLWIFNFHSSFSDELISAFEIVTGFQNYTYLLQKNDVSLSTYTCDPDRDICRINFDFRDSFSDEYPARLYTCTFQLSFDPDFTPNDPCNPPGFILPIGSHTATIEISEKDNPDKNYIREIQLTNSDSDDEVKTGSGSTIPMPDVVLPIDLSNIEPFIRIQSGLESDFRCKKSDCKMNVIVENIGAEFGCQWEFGGGTYVTEDTDMKCNPGYVTYGVGEFFVSLTIFQKDLPENSTTLSYTVTNTQHRGGTSLESLEARIDLQGVIGNNKKLTGNRLVCTGDDTCSVNLDGRNSSGHIDSYVWDFAGETIVGANPPARRLPIGNHEITLTIRDLGGDIDEVIFYVEVMSDTQGSKSSGPVTAIIDLQGVIGKDKTLEGNSLVCRTKDTCSLNFDGSQSAGSGLSYRWELGDGAVSDVANPAGYRLGLGVYDITLEVTDHAGQTDIAQFDVRIIDPYTAVTLDPTCTGECFVDTNIGSVSISKVFPNPHHKDTLEWIELKNQNMQDVSLWGCQLDDMIDGGSKAFVLDGFTIQAGASLRLYKPQTKLNLNNTLDDVHLICAGRTIDALSWSMSIPSGYIIDHESFSREPKRVHVQGVLDGDTIGITYGDSSHIVRLLGVDTPETVHPFKPVELFGMQASEYTKNQLFGEDVWITFDRDPIDKYGRKLVYVWLGNCQARPIGQAEDCELFNADLITSGHARMERRFGFVFYDWFDGLERVAKKEKVGLWSNSEISLFLKEEILEEKELYEQELEQEFLDAQESYLEGELIDLTAEDVSDITTIQTQDFSTMRVSQRKDTSVRIAGQTWSDSTILVHAGKRKIETISDQHGMYEYIWIPDNTGLVDVSTMVNYKGSLIGIGSKQILIDRIVSNFLEPLSASIVVQGRMSKNRWVDGDIFYCRSRKGCSINLDGDTGDREFISYAWKYSTGERFHKQNPPSVKMPHGTHYITMYVVDTLTGEHINTTLTVRSLPLPTKAKKSVSATNRFKKVRLSSEDVGGGSVAPERKELTHVSTIIFVLLTSPIIRYALIKGRKKS